MQEKKRDITEPIMISFDKINTIEHSMGFSWNDKQFSITAQEKTLGRLEDEVDEFLIFSLKGRTDQKLFTIQGNRVQVTEAFDEEEYGGLKDTLLRNFAAVFKAIKEKDNRKVLDFISQAN